MELETTPSRSCWKTVVFSSVVAAVMAGTAGFYIGRNNGEESSHEPVCRLTVHEQASVTDADKAPAPPPVPDLTIEEAFKILKKEDVIYISENEFWKHAREYLKGFEPLNGYDYLDKIVSCYAGSSFLKGNVEALRVIKAFLKEGAVFKEDSLFYIVDMGEYPSLNTNDRALMDLMLERGCRPTTAWNREERFSSFDRTRWGDQPLHVIARHNSLKRARILLEHGADVNGLNAKGETPLDCATHPEFKDYLISMGGKFSYEL